MVLSGAMGTSLLLAGCATITRGNSQDYLLDSKPQGATVTLSTGESCVTPCRIERPRREMFEATFRLDGHDSATVLVETRRTGSAAFSGAVGAIVDMSNDSLFGLYPDPLLVELPATGSRKDAVLLNQYGVMFSTVDAHNRAARRDAADRTGGSRRSRGAETEPPEPPTAEH